MKNYTYKTFSENFKAEPTDKEGKRVETATKNFNCEGEACYVIFIDGRMNNIEFESSMPYPDINMELAAQKHIDEMKKQEALSAQEAIK